MGTLVCDVIVQRPLPGALTYKVPEELTSEDLFGKAVEVPFRKSKMLGFISRVYNLDKTPEYEIKSLSNLVTQESVFSNEDLKFYEWVSEYYQIPIGEVFHSAFPKSIFEIPKRKSNSKETHSSSPLLDSSIALTEDQRDALDSIESSIHSSKYNSFLLFGVTGSGKTEVYMKAAELALKKGKTALVLVPEIALTPQLTSRFESRFGDQVAILHSGLTDKARRDFWWEIRRGKRNIIVGARSAIFAPVSRLGLIVVDEEHEPSYKQEDRLRYNARDLALVRAKMTNATVILGSATPAIETFYAATTGKHKLLELKSRPNERPMPTIELIDMRQEPLSENHDERPIFSQKMQNALREILVKGEQAILFINRKGYANFGLCTSCGDVPKCLNCSVSLTYYSHSRLLRCHYCAFEIPTNDQCSKCQSLTMKYIGLGTELIEEETKRLFPGISIARLDADTAPDSKRLRSILDDFRNQKTQILIGTQMLAKGHDFPNVTFVGVVLADSSLSLPDFRSSERTFQLLSQVAGRAGRSDKPGTVYIQTYMPDHNVIQTVKEHDYRKFFEDELAIRHEFMYPPFSKMAHIEFRNLKEATARDEATRTGNLLNHLNETRPEFSYLGPAPASISKISNQYRWQLLLRSEKSSALNSIIKTLRKEGVRFIDIDPITTL